MDFLRTLGEKHEALKNRIHSFRIPLSPAGQRVMLCVYFSAPIVAGYYIMQWTNGVAAKNIGDRGSALKNLPAGRAMRRETDLQNKELQNVFDRIKMNEKYRQHNDNNNVGAS